MIVTIQPSHLKGIILAPASKSSMQRACAAALLTRGRSVISNPGHSNDDKAARDIIQKLGARTEMINEEMIIDSDGVNPVSDEINCGESGLSIRMFTPIAALSDREIMITGEGTLLNRPMDLFDRVLPALGVTVKSHHGKLPLVIRGPLQPGNIEVDGSMSSQFLTGLLMAYGASPNLSGRMPPKASALAQGVASEDSANSKSISMKVKNLKSKPYIDLTLDVMKKFRLRVPENREYKEFIFHNDYSNILPSGIAFGNPPVAETEGRGGAYTVEGDWSGGAFLLVAGAIAGPITVRGLDLTSSQPDKAIVGVLIAANAGIAIEAKGIKVLPGEMKAFEFDATDCPDLFPPLVALATYCKGESRIKGLSRLTHKESDRSLALKEEMGKMGVKIEITADNMIIRGGHGVKGAKVHSHHDHRIAMACAVAALKAIGETVIEDAGAVRKSYPDFYEHIKYLGAEIQQ